MKTLVEGVLHMIPAPLLDVATRGVPEPLEAVLGATVPLCPKVMGHVRLHRLEELDLVIVQILQRLFSGCRGQPRHHHVPGVMEAFNVVSNQLETLEVVGVVKHLTAIARSIIAKDHC